MAVGTMPEHAHVALGMVKADIAVPDGTGTRSIMAELTPPYDLTRRDLQLLVMCERTPDGFVPLIRSDQYRLEALEEDGLVERCEMLRWRLTQAAKDYLDDLRCDDRL
jgi:hypothetical protein